MDRNSASRLVSQSGEVQSIWKKTHGSSTINTQVSGGKPYWQRIKNDRDIPFRNSHAFDSSLSSAITLKTSKKEQKSS